MANAFNKGDVVVLKSGGPPMTIDEVPGDPGTLGSLGSRTNYFCRWFRGATACDGSYNEHLIEKYTPPAKK